MYQLVLYAVLYSEIHGTPENDYCYPGMKTTKYFNIRAFPGLLNNFKFNQLSTNFKIQSQGVNWVSRLIQRFVTVDNLLTQNIVLQTLEHQNQQTTRKDDNGCNRRRNEPQYRFESLPTKEEMEMG